MRKKTSPIVQQLEAWHRANAPDDDVLLITPPIARSIGHTFASLKAAIERGEIPVALVGRSGGYHLARSVIERLRSSRS